MQGEVKVLLRASVILLGAFLLDSVTGEDTSEHCSYWAALGECTKNSGMHKKEVCFYTAWQNLDKVKRAHK